MQLELENSLYRSQLPQVYTSIQILNENGKVNQILSTNSCVEQYKNQKI